jgi:hypothetical protein
MSLDFKKLNAHDFHQVQTFAGSLSPHLETREFLRRR